MANVNRPNGLTPIMYVGGNPYNGASTPYLIPSGDGTAVFLGDLVKLEGTSGAADSSVNGINTEGMPTVIRAAAGNAVIGVVVGFDADRDSLLPNYRLASTARIVQVCDDPLVVYEVQEDSTGAAVTQAQVGLSADVLATAGSTASGRSREELDSSTAAAAGGQLRIMRLAPRTDSESTSGNNQLGTNAKWYVKINEHQTFCAGSSTDV